MTETVEGVCNIVADNSSKVEEEEKLNMAVNEKNIEDITSSVKNDENSVQFVLVYQNQRLQITFELDNTILKLKEHVQTLTEIPPNMQKIMYKGLAKDESTLRSLNIKNGDKLMLIGSKPQDVAQVMQKPTVTQNKAPNVIANAKKEPLSTELPHKKVIEKYGKPDDCMPADKTKSEPLPHVPLYGMINKSGQKIRLTFKLESDELWLSTKDRTDKLPMTSIKSIISEAIVGNEEYSIMGIQFGATEASRYWIYWVPSQYVVSIRRAFFG